MSIRSFEVPGRIATVEGAVSALADGSCHFRDLNPALQISYVERVRQEHDENPSRLLSGDATQALIVNNLRLLSFGARRVIPFSGESERLYTLDDAIHDAVLSMRSGWLTKLDPTQSFSSYFISRPHSTTRRNSDRYAQRGVTYPSNLLVYRILSIIDELMVNEATSEPSNKLLEQAIELSGTSKPVIGNDATKIGQAVYFLSTIDEIPSHTPTDEQELETRLGIEHDTDDDEWVNPSDATDERSLYVYDDLEDEHDQKKFVESLAWDVVTDKEKEVIELRIGLNGKNVHTFKEIGVVLKVSRQGAQQIYSKAISALLDPSERRARKKKR